MLQVFHLVQHYKPSYQFKIIDDLNEDDMTPSDEHNDVGKVRLCSSILDTLWQRCEFSINQVIVDSDFALEMRLSHF